jgi:Lon protease-like protein
VRDPLPLFPLNTVLFPGLVLPLHVFEDGYRVMMRDILADVPAQPPEFGVVAIKVGYEVGDHGARTIHSLGCVAQIDDVTANPEGTYDIIVRGTERFRLESVDRSGDYLRGRPQLVPERAGDNLAEAESRARHGFARYRGIVEGLRGIALLEGALPDNAAVLSYVLAATVVMELGQRQQLLESATVADRLRRLSRLMDTELHTIAAIASLPATDIARTGWSPN